MSNWTWADRAVCVGVELDEMVPETNSVADELLAEMRVTAETLCAGCPVQASCRKAGDDAREVGLWGAVYRVDAGRGYQRFPLLPGIELGPLPVQRPVVERRRKPAARAAASRRCSSGAVADRYAAVDELLDQGVPVAEVAVRTAIPERTVRAAAGRRAKAAS